MDFINRQHKTLLALYGQKKSYNSEKREVEGTGTETTEIGTQKPKGTPELRHPLSQKLYEMLHNALNNGTHARQKLADYLQNANPFEVKLVVSELAKKAVKGMTLANETLAEVLQNIPQAKTRSFIMNCVKEVCVKIGSLKTYNELKKLEAPQAQHTKESSFFPTPTLTFR